MIYLDNGATTLKKPQVVIDAVVNAMSHLGNAGRGTTEASLEAGRTIFNARYALNQLINGEDASHITFTLNATESLNIAIKGSFKSGDHIISTVMEHNSVLRPLYELQEQGVEVTFLPLEEKGHINPQSLEAAIQPHTKGVVLTHASNLTGNINPIQQISQITQQHQLLLIVDASQTMGAIPIDVQALGIDILCFTGHKSLYGPQGTGGLYVKPGIQIRPLKTGGTGVDTFNHQHPTKFPTALEAGTLNGHGIAGLSAAVNFLLDYGVDRIQKEERILTDYFVSQVTHIPGIKLLGDFSTEDRCPIVSLDFIDSDSAEVSEALIELYEIATRGGGHCAPLMHQALGTKERGAVRFSFSHFTTKEELDQAIMALKAIQTED